MSSSTDSNEYKNTLDIMSSWPFALLVAVLGLFILLMQEVWSTVSGLYFPHAYEAVVIPYFGYLFWSLYVKCTGTSANKAKTSTLTFTFMLIFLPGFYLLATNQVDLHGMIFSEYDATLDHMPGAELLPYLFIAVLFSPAKLFNRIYRGGKE